MYYSAGNPKVNANAVPKEIVKRGKMQIYQFALYFRNIMDGTTFENIVVLAETEEQARFLAEEAIKVHNEEFDSCPEEYVFLSRDNATVIPMEPGVISLTWKT